MLRVASQLDTWREVAFNREFRTVTGTYKDIPVTVTSTGIGGASTAIAIEELVACGAKRIIRIGSAGALQTFIANGDFIIVTGAIRHDGTSAKYIEPAFPAVADFRLTLAILETCRDLGDRYHLGLVHSHDSLYSDNQREVEDFWHRKNVLGSDMETATLFTLAHLRQIQAASILNVVVEYKTDLKEGISAFTQSANGEERQIRLALETLRR